MATFRPTARVRLQLRVDELADTADLRASLEREPPQGAAFGSGGIAGKAGTQAALQANQQKRTQLNQARATIPGPTLKREISSLNAERSALMQSVAKTEAQDKPLGLQENPEDDLNVILSVLPLHGEISRNGLKDADSCTVQFDFRDVPIDPRIVRAGLVSFALGTVDAGDYADGILDQKTRDDGSLRSIVDRKSGQELSFHSTTQFTGFVDEWGVSYTDDGDSVTLICRDVSAVLRDQVMPAGYGIDMKLPIAEGVQQMIDQFPGLRGLKVKFGTPTDPADPLNVFTPSFGPIPADTIVPIQKLRKKKKKSKAIKKSKDMNVWDHIVETCNKMGLVPVMRSFTLFILEPRVMFSNLRGARRMVWGRNIKSLDFARKLGGTRSDTIEIRCPDSSIGRTRWARFPVVDGEPRSGVLGLIGSPQPVTSRASTVTPNGLAEERVLVRFIRGVGDLAVLERVAESTFNEIGRQEIEGSLTTDDIESFESQMEADLLALQPGEAVTIQVAPPAEVSEAQGSFAGGSAASSANSLQELQAQSVALRQAYLQGLGMSADTAKKLAIAQESIRLISTFRASHVNITWDAEDGVSVEFDFYNFVVLRDSPDEQPSVEPSKSLSGAAGDSVLDTVKGAF